MPDNNISFNKKIYIEKDSRNLALHDGCQNSTVSTLVHMILGSTSTVGHILDLVFYQDKGYIYMGGREFEICCKWTDHYRDRVEM